MSTPIHLGPFVLRSPLASGGMGTVWRAEHERTGTRVAVKCLRLDQRNASRFATDALMAEIRAVAAMHHPAIVQIHDHGLVDAVAAERSDDRLHEGTPWFAMEYADRGDLDAWRADLDWPDLRAILLQLLEGLAHAHARGVVHLDLKPANVLFSSTRSGARLSDFGMVFQTGTVEPGRQVTRGTPLFMSPEQVSDDWRSLGPWTDLYALGCLTWLCVTGRPWVTDGTAAAAILTAQLYSTPGPFRPRFDVPEGLEAWVRRLLAKDPAARFRFAADATLALHRLDPELQVPGSGDEAVVLEDDTTSHWGSDEFTGEVPRPRPGGALHVLASGPRPPIPAEWRVDDEHAPPEDLPGAGLGLVSLREPPVIGRTVERQVLWDALREAAAGTPRLVVLRGPAGSGKSCLARWLCHRAHELGAARWLRGTAEEEPGVGDGLLAMLHRHLHVDPHDPEAAERVRAVLEGRGLDAEPATNAAKVLTGDPRALQAPDGGSAPVARALADVLAAVSVERLPLVWLDDVHHDLEALQAVRWTLDEGRPRSVLWVLTVRDEALADAPDADEALSALQRRDEATVIPLGPLSEQASTALARRMVDLEPGLAATVVRRAAGNPLFTLELVDDWARRDLLEHGPNGYRLRPGAEVSLPTSLAELCAHHLEDVLGERPGWRVPLEAAALLGNEVDQQEWYEVCERLGAPAPRQLVLALVRRRLVQLDPETQGHRWTFAHSMLREVAADRSAREGRAEAIHRACAEVLAVHDADPERLGLHLLRGGRPADAIEPLLQAARHREGGETGHREQLLRTAEVTATHHLDGADPRWPHIWDLRARVLLEQGRLRDARLVADRLEAAANTHRWPGARFLAARALSRITRAAGQLDDSLAHALDAVDRSDGGAQLGDALVEQATTLRLRGRLHEARTAVEWATLLALPEASREAREVFHEAARVAHALGRHHAARRYLLRLAASAEAADARGWLALTAHGLAEASFALGELDTALDQFRVARRRYRALGHADAVLAQVGLVRVLLAQGHEDRATEALERARGHEATAVHHLWLGLADVVLRADKPLDRRFDEAWGRVQEIIERTGVADPAVAEALSLASERATRAQRSQALGALAKKVSAR